MPSLSAFFLTLLPILTSSGIGLWMIQNESFISNFGLKEWILACIVCVFGCALALIPPTLLAFGAGYFLGWKGFTPLVLLNLMSIALIYVIVSQMDKNGLRRYVIQFPRVATFFNQVQKEEMRFVFFAKLSPVLPFALTNLVFVLMDLRLRNIFVGGFLGMIPRTALAVWVGMEAQGIRQLIQNPNESVVSRVVILVLVVVSIIGLLRIVVRK